MDASQLGPPQSGPQWIARGAAGIYWTLSDSVMRCSVDDCVPEVFASNQVYPNDLAAGAVVAWVWSDTQRDSGVFASRETAPDASLVAPAAYAAGVALDATRVYWTEKGDPGSGFSNGAVYSANFDGSARATIASGLPNVARVAVDADTVYFTVSGTGAADGRVATCKKATSCGSTPTVLAYNQRHPLAIAVDDANVYWSNIDDGTGHGTVMSCPKPSCAGGPVALASETNAYSIAEDDRAVYWASLKPDGGVFKLAK
jgi:hypothetical protein